jgi:hypothetical protein
MIQRNFARLATAIGAATAPGFNDQSAKTMLSDAL